MHYDMDFFLDNQVDETTETVKPFHTVAQKDKKEVLEWLKSATKILREQQSVRTRRQRDYLEMYRGVHVSAKRRRSNSNHLDSKSSQGKLVVNHLYDLTESKISQFTRIKEAPEVLPGSDEHSDKIAARGAKKVLNHLEHVNDLDFLKQRVHRSKEIMGEVYAMVEWNPYKGDLDPEYVDGETLLTTPEGKIINDMLGKPIKLDPLQARIGEVEVKMELPWRILLQRKREYCDVEYGFHMVPENIETLKKEYPNVEFKKQDAKIFDLETLETKPLEDQVIVYHFYHRPTKFIPKGFYIKFTEHAILEMDAKAKYGHGDFPWERLTAIDMPGVLDGVSKYELLGDMQNTNTNIFNLILKNIKMTAHNKWVMPRGAAKIESLGSDNTVVQFNGPMAPQLVSAPPLTSDVYKLLDYTEQQLSKKFAAGQVSRGEPPKGVTAAVALQFLNEMENERASSDIAKHNNFMKNLYRKMLSVAAEYYQPDDGRLLRIMGEDSKFLVKAFDMANMNKTYDVVINNGTALPETKSAKTQRVIEYLQYGGDLAIQKLGVDKIMELLDLGQPDKMISMLTEAVRSAEAENEIIINGEGMPLIEEYEDHISHWRIHVREIQKLSFKLDVDVELQDKMREHIRLTEIAMMEKAKKNPEFQAKLATLDLFPIFIDAPAPMSREQQQAEVQGAANRGEPTNLVAAPAQSPEDPTLGGN